MTRLPIEEYLAVDAEHWSTLREMDRSPLHFRYAKDHQRQDKAGFIRGRAGHTAILEPERFLLDYFIFEGKVRRGRAYDDACEANPGKTALTRAEYQTALDLAQSVRSHPRAVPYLAQGRAEQCVVWRDHETGLLCKARPDWLCDAEGFACNVEIKTTSDLAGFSRVCARLGHHCQVALQLRGLRASEWLVPAVIIAVESKAPHDVSVLRMEGDALAAGDAKVGELLRRVKEQYAAGVWPGRYPEEQPLALPPWVFGDQNDLSGLDLEWESANAPAPEEA